MNPQNIYIFISIAVLLILALLMFFVARQKKEKPLTTLTSLAFAFILAGIIFGEERWLGYSLMGIGVILAVVDMIRKLRKPT